MLAATQKRLVPRWLIPNAGPPAFLDDDLFDINDFGQPGNVFPDQSVFIEHLRSMGIENALMVSTGTSVELARGAEPVVTHPGRRRSEDCSRLRISVST